MQGKQDDYRHMIWTTSTSSPNIVTLINSASQAADVIGKGEVMETCKTCKHWKIIEDDRSENERSFLKCCHHPRLQTPDYDKPDRECFADGAMVVDGSGYWGRLMTGPDFGCVNHEAKPRTKAEKLLRFERAMIPGNIKIHDEITKGMIG